MDPTTVHRRRWWTLGVLSLSLLVIMLDNTILNVALPTIRQDLNASASQLQWVLDAYVLVFAGLLSQATPTSGYGLVAAFLVLQSIGMGLAMVPATDSIMAALPPAKAGVGSAMNDMVRQVGGALGVAVLGSVLSAEYGRRMAETATQLPGQLGALARDSIGAAHTVAGQLGPAGRTVVAAADRAFTGAMSVTVLVAAAIAVAGAVVAALFLPAREAPQPSAPAEQPDGVDLVGAPA